MTPEQIILVQSSFERLGPGLPAMATRFYQELFARDPALRSLFTTPLAEQEVKFAVKLTEIVQAIPHLDELLSHTRALGARHVGYGGTGCRLPDPRQRPPRRARGRPWRQLRHPHTRGMGPRLQPRGRDHARGRSRGPARGELITAHSHAETRIGGAQRTAALEHRQLGEQAPPGFGQRPVAPVNGGRMTRWRSGRSRGPSARSRSCGRVFAAGRPGAAARPRPPRTRFNKSSSHGRQSRPLRRRPWRGRILCVANARRELPLLPLRAR